MARKANLYPLPKTPEAWAEEWETIHRLRDEGIIGFDAKMRLVWTNQLEIDFSEPRPEAQRVPIAVRRRDRTGDGSYHRCRTGRYRSRSDFRY